MHRYEPLWSNDPDRDVPSPASFTFRDAQDVGAFAAIDPLTTWYSYPHFWHLDEHGSWWCCSKGSSLDTLQGLGKRPNGLLDCRETDIGHPCPDFWVMLFPRQRWLGSDYESTEADAAAYLSLRRWFHRRGIQLLDAIVLTDDFRWWSMHELTTGSTAWAFDRPSAGRPPRRRC